MTPEAVLATVQSVALAVSEVFKWLQTPEGSEAIKKALEDRQVWDDFWKEIGGGIKGLFSGDVLK